MSKNIEFWKRVKDVSQGLGKSTADIHDTGVRTAYNSAKERTTGDKTKARRDVITCAKFIANIEPSYVNSQGANVSLNVLRSIQKYSADDMNFLLDKLYDTVKPFITKSTETRIQRGKLYIETDLKKDRLVKLAIKHLLVGSELFSNPDEYSALVSRSCMAGFYKENYGYLIGVAQAMHYKSVAELMEDACLSFVDQQENLEQTGNLVFYDGGYRTGTL